MQSQGIADMNVFVSPGSSNLIFTFTIWEGGGVSNGV